MSQSPVTQDPKLAEETRREAKIRWEGEGTGE